MSKTPSNESDKNIKTGTPIQKNLEAIAPTNKDHNNTTEIERILRQFELWLGLAKIGAVNSSAAEHTLNRKQATTQLQNLIIKERQAELAQTVLAGMRNTLRQQQRSRHKETIQ